jgi:uncharacterized protein (DUF4415 family)
MGMRKKKSVSKRAWVDPDDAPALTRTWFETAGYDEGGKLVRRGRPKSAVTKEAVSLRLDPEVLRHFRATGPSWQSRINAALRKVAKLGS